MADLKTTYKDDLLDTSVNEKRKYNMIQNADGTVSFEDVTTYSQIGDSFGAVDINATNEKVNEVNSNLSLDYSNASTDIQDLHTFLQKALDKLFPAFDGKIYDNGKQLISLSNDGFYNNNRNDYTKINAIFGSSSINSSINVDETYTAFGNVEKIDITNFNTLHIACNIGGIGGTHDIDISSLSGEKYIFVLHMRFTNTNGVIYCYIGDYKDASVGYNRREIIKTATSNAGTAYVNAIWLTK